MPLPLVAYACNDPTGWSIEPATLQREWMDQTILRNAYRCLPLAMANQAGWVIRCPASFKAFEPSPDYAERYGGAASTR